MRTIYLDAEFHCHPEAGEGRTAAETDFFDGKCDAFLEGYRFVPAGSLWTREDGTEFTGEMAAPWKDYTLLSAYQEQYEVLQQQLTQAYQEGVNSL
ncbi:MAG: hypothetical protein ACI3VA_12615 [Candidatus Limivicinus sp.]